MGTKRVQPVYERKGFTWSATRQNWAFLQNQKIGLKMDQVEPEDKLSK